MSEFPQFSEEDKEFLTNLGREMDRHLELTEPTHEDLQERLGFLNYYFGTERRRLIVNYLNDRLNNFHHSELIEQDTNAKALFENTVDMMFKLDEPLYTSVDDMPVGREMTLIRLFHLADISQNDLNLFENDLPLRLHIRDLREAIMTIMELPDEAKQAKILAFFDHHIWSTVRRFLEFGEDRP